ncbi:MAG TPA: PAS domain S-box protein [Candidatus Binatia bacterium]|nr:PAS domain S-box protein [Candidatus Binatia bacterium]
MRSPFPQTLIALFEAAPFGVFAIDQQGIIVYVNLRQCENSQLPWEDFIGKHYRTSFYSTLESQGLLAFYDRLQQEGISFEVTLPHYRRHSDGALMAFSMRGYQHEEYTFLFTTIEEVLETHLIRYQQLFEHANDGIFILDRQARFAEVNQKFAAMTGLSREEILGKTTELFLPGRFAQSLARLERILREGKLGPYELEVATPLGTKMFSLNAFALYEGELPVGVMNIARDVTAERRQQQEQEALYALAHDLVRLTDTRTVGENLFTRAQELLGAEYGWLLLLNEAGTELPVVAVGGPGTDTWPRESIPLNEPAPATVALQERRTVIIPDLGQSPLASPRVRATYAAVTTVVAVPLYQGELAIGSFAAGWQVRRDLSPHELALLELLANEAALAFVRVRLTERLRESEARYRALFENANDAFVSGTLDGTITAVNRGLEVMLGWSREELIGHHYGKIVTPATFALGEERTRRVLAGEKLPAVFEAEMVRKDGSVVPIEARTRFIRDKEGNPIGFQGVYRDISVRKTLERQQTEFLAMLTHDLRNPLAAILGYLDILAEETAEKRSAGEDDILQRLKDNALTIHSLIANYLDLIKVEAGNLVLQKTPQALGSILQRVAEQYSAIARRHHLTLTVALPDQELPLIAGDTLALERIFANLVHNALKFTPATGQVVVSAHQRTNGAREVVVEVRDTGPGIAPEELSSLFVKYHRIAATRQQEGTGLGLFIVKTLVEAQGGQVEVESRLGQGTCFRILLPAVSLS